MTYIPDEVIENSSTLRILFAKEDMQINALRDRVFVTKLWREGHEQKALNWKVII